MGCFTNALQLVKTFPSKYKIETTEDFYKKNRNSDHYNLIFNFFYGDEASKSLEFPTFGINSEINGFDYARSATIP